ncbi:hypothetical protein EJ04DRAFT_101954 [Polyplosphaeria fusca]|uniref:Uncharacterized protein n=1 Tax=Polyplosphaeria fusca TaxID=682080 RepID=A0A9P4QP39_9PLEO|nr:hypothetical protein EJ04DRAFT_101954 [Polyplosphaeria fusca]
MRRAAVSTDEAEAALTWKALALPADNPLSTKKKPSNGPPKIRSRVARIELRRRCCRPPKRTPAALVPRRGPQRTQKTQRPAEDRRGPRSREGTTHRRAARPVRQRKGRRRRGHRSCCLAAGLLGCCAPAWLLAGSWLLPRALLPALVPPTTTTLLHLKYSVHHFNSLTARPHWPR